MLTNRQKNILIFFISKALLFNSGYYLILSITNKDSWICTILGSVLGLLFCFILKKLIINNYINLNNIIIKLLLIIFSILIIKQTIFTIKDFINFSLLPNTPKFIIILPLILITIYISFKDYKLLSYLIECLFPICIFEDMKNPKKWTALNEYKRSADGDYVYTGGYYAPVDAATYGKRCRVFVLCGACVAALVVAQGLLTAGGMKNTFYVLLPFLGEVICLFLAVWNTVRLLYAGDRIKHYVYESVTKTIPGALLALSVFAAAAFIGSVVFLFCILHKKTSKKVKMIS